MTLQSTAYSVRNPQTNEIHAQYDGHSDAQIHGSISMADEAFTAWRTLTVQERASYLERAAQLFESRADDLGAIINREMGKTLSAATGEARFVASILRYYAENAATLLEDEQFSPRSGGHAVIQKRPLGVLLGIMPWNYPLYQVIRFVAPNLLLGNTVILKHAPSCPESAVAIEEIFRDAGLPEGCYVNVFATNEQVESIIADARVHGVSLTGSERAGSAVAALAGRYLKKVALELGGSDACIVAADADLESSVPTITASRLANWGQACNSPKRIIVVNNRLEEFTNRIGEHLNELYPSLPGGASGDLPPMASADAAQTLALQVEDALGKGAKLAYGTAAVQPGSAHYGPVVLTGVTPEMRAYHEELFGPVFVIYGVPDIAEAVNLANDTEFGLSASIYTQDDDLAAEVTEQIDVGMVYINRSPDSDADVPFGGIKKSGFGRELGALGITEFSNRKLVWTA